MAVNRRRTTAGKGTNPAQPQLRARRGRQAQAIAKENNIEAIVEPSPTTDKDESAVSAVASTGKREGLATRNANSDKHPGLATLDDEDIQAMNRKDRAIAKRQADAKQKKIQEALLAIGVDKIAAHEDHLLSQINQDPKTVARPLPGRIARKANRPIATEDTTKVEANKAAAESDTSRLSDEDFQPDDVSGGSEGESEVVDDVFTEIDEEEKSSKKGQKGPASQRKQAPMRGQVRAMIEAQRKMPVQQVAPNTGKRKTVVDNAIADPLNLTTPSSKKIKPSAPLAITENDKNDFNFDYGGIMDDEIQEVAPQSTDIKPLQVKPMTRIIHNAPLIKVEALDPGVPRAQTSKPRKERGVDILGLSSTDMRHFKTLVRAFRAVLAVQTAPWDNSNPELLEELAFLWRTIFPHLPRVIEADGKERIVAMQRLNEYRSKIGSDVMNAVDCYIKDTCGETCQSTIEEHVGYLLEKARYMWLDHDSENANDFKGLFLPSYIIAGITSHLEMTAGLPDELDVADFPCGALALSTVAAERGLKAWTTGIKTFSTSASRGIKKQEEFSEANWGAATHAIMQAVKNVTEKKWTKILSAAAEAAPSVATPRFLKRKMETQTHVDDNRAMAFEADSD
ncbi:hypothetical protein H0H92_008234 [Tricholoma furcatifolium]|nr:hypothetical protein H0H92_008234 [Tricholoma furcatifolium]